MSDYVNIITSTDEETGTTNIYPIEGQRLSCGSVGDESHPVYFDGGVPVQCSGDIGGGGGDTVIITPDANISSLNRSEKQEIATFQINDGKEQSLYIPRYSSGFQKVTLFEGGITTPITGQSLLMDFTNFQFLYIYIKDTKNLVGTHVEIVPVPQLAERIPFGDAYVSCTLVGTLGMIIQFTGEQAFNVVQINNLPNYDSPDTGEGSIGVKLIRIEGYTLGISKGSWGANTREALWIAESDEGGTVDPTTKISFLDDKNLNDYDFIYVYGHIAEETEEHIDTGSVDKLKERIDTQDAFLTCGSFQNITKTLLFDTDGFYIYAGNDIDDLTYIVTQIDGIKYGAEITNQDLSNAMIKDIDYVTAGNAIGNSRGTKATAEGSTNYPFGDFSHVEGYNTYAYNLCSHSEGYKTTANGKGAHAEGRYIIVNGDGAHGEGHGPAVEEGGYITESYNTVEGKGSHAEGYGTSAYGLGAHAEGCVHHHGNIVTADGRGAHAEGLGTCAEGDGAHAEGECVYAFGFGAHAEGQYTYAASISHAEGIYTRAEGQGAHAEGGYTHAHGDFSHAEGYDAWAADDNTHAEGYHTYAQGHGSHVEGCYTCALGPYSHAEGQSTSTLNFNTHSGGYKTYANNNNCVALGQHNILMVAENEYEGYIPDTDPSKRWTGPWLPIGKAFVIGNGRNEYQQEELDSRGKWQSVPGTYEPPLKSNAFSVDFNGNTSISGTYSASSSSDYAEYFEWADGNNNEEDRVGYFVTFDEEKNNQIKIATNEDEYILGVVSGDPFVLGNGDCDIWNGVYLRDDYGRIKYNQVKSYIPILDENEEIVSYKEELDEKGKNIYKQIPVLNPDYDRTKKYISRKERKEWSPIGMLGILSVRDDGTCVPGKYCKIKENGVATYQEKYNRNENYYRVTQRVSDNVIKIVFK